MGLDSVELVMDIEKTFNITISDEEAGNIGTVGDLYTCVLKKLENKEAEKCASAVLFYKLRKYFIEKKGIDKQNFLPETSLNELILPTERRSQWQGLKEELNLNIPPLVLTPAANLVNAIVQVSLVLVSFIYALGAVIFFSGSWLCWLLPLGGIVISILIYRLSEPWRIYIDEDHVKELVEKIIRLNFKSIHSLYQMNKQEIIQIINLIIQDKSGVEMSEIKPEAHLVYDLGIN